MKGGSAGIGEIRQIIERYIKLNQASNVSPSDQRIIFVTECQALVQHISHVMVDSSFRLIMDSSHASHQISWTKQVVEVIETTTFI